MPREEIPHFESGTAEQIYIVLTNIPMDNQNVCTSILRRQKRGAHDSGHGPYSWQSRQKIGHSTVCSIADAYLDKGLQMSILPVCIWHISTFNRIHDKSRYFPFDSAGPVPTDAAVVWPKGVHDVSNPILSNCMTLGHSSGWSLQWDIIDRKIWVSWPSVSVRRISHPLKLSVDTSLLQVQTSDRSFPTSRSADSARRTATQARVSLVSSGARFARNKRKRLLYVKPCNRNMYRLLRTHLEFHPNIRVQTRSRCTDMKMQLSDAPHTWTCPYDGLPCSTFSYSSDLQTCLFLPLYGRIFLCIQIYKWSWCGQLPTQTIRVLRSGVPTYLHLPLHHRFPFVCVCVMPVQ